MPTGPREIETPTGPQVGNVFATMQVLGVGSFVTQTGNQPNNLHQWEETVDISTPVGTQVVIPCQDFWSLLFGSFDVPLDPLDPNVIPQWNASDHNWGAGRAQITVLNVNAPNFQVSAHGLVFE